VNARDSLERFQDAVRAKHRAIHICRQIATGSKHMNIRKPDPAIKTEEVWQPQAVAGRMECGRTPLGSYLYRRSLIDAGTPREALEVFREAFTNWEEELGCWGFIEGRYIHGLDTPAGSGAS